MTKNRILNKWQINNLEVLDQITLARLRSGDWRDLPTQLIKCIRCGRSCITAPILAFFNFQGERARCYPCQKINY